MDSAPGPGAPPASTDAPPAPAAAAGALAERIRAGGNAKDAEYFAYHRPRYERTVRRMHELAAPRATVLDIGSHYLHQGGMLALAGFNVVGLDVPDFTELDWVRRRAEALNIRNETVGDLSAGDFLPAERDAYDAVVFTETLEHITFNPIRFWKRVSELLHVDGFVYLTTPNAYEFRQLRKVLKRLFTGRGIGLRVGAIFRHVTYGHHWKLYCARELRTYFAELSDDFMTEVSAYSLPLGASHLHHPTRQALQRCFDRIPLFRSHLEAVVRLRGRDGWRATPPSCD